MQYSWSSETPEFIPGRITFSSEATDLNPWLCHDCEAPRTEVRGFPTTNYDKSVGHSRIAGLKNKAFYFIYQEIGLDGLLDECIGLGQGAAAEDFLELGVGVGAFKRHPRDDYDRYAAPFLCGAQESKQLYPV